MNDKCPKCASAVPDSEQACPVCQTMVGFPNVRMAERQAEKKALSERVKQARVSAALLNCTAELEDFAETVLRSKAVMNRKLGPLHNWLIGDNPLFATYFHQRQAGRLPSGSDWDEQRFAAEAAINPYCFNDISFAALTLDKEGLSYYGMYAVILKEISIEDRSTVFEENPFLFNRKHHVYAGTLPPHGFRAKWSERWQVAVAKLHPRIRTGFTASDFLTVLMEARRDEADCDFVEVHIYGPINRGGIELVSGPKPKRGADAVLWSSMKRALKACGALVEEV